MVWEWNNIWWLTIEENYFRWNFSLDVNFVILFSFFYVGRMEFWFGREYREYILKVKKD